MNKDELLLKIWGNLPVGTPDAEGVAKRITDLVADWHNEQVSNFVEDTEALGQSYIDRAREKNVAINVSQYREGKADGLYAAAARANRMKI